MEAEQMNYSCKWKRGNFYHDLLINWQITNSKQKNMTYGII